MKVKELIKSLNNFNPKANIKVRLKEEEEDFGRYSTEIFELDISCIVVDGEIFLEVLK